MTFTVPTALRTLGQAALRAGRLTDAAELIDEAIAGRRGGGQRLGGGLALAAKAAIALRQNKLKSAQRILRGRAGGAERQQPLGGGADPVRAGHGGPGPRRRRHGAAAFRGGRGDLPRAGRLARDRPLPGRGRLGRAGPRRPRPGPGPAGREPADQPGLRPAARHRPRAGGVRGAGRGPAAARAGRPAGRGRVRAARVAGPAGPASAPGSRRVLDLARGRLGAAAAAALFAEGREMPADDAVGYALGSAPRAPGGPPERSRALPGAAGPGTRAPRTWAGPARRPGPTRRACRRRGPPRRSPRASTRSWS